MAFQVSPGVLVREIDLTNVVPAVATSIGAIADSLISTMLVRLHQSTTKLHCYKSLVGLTIITLRHGLPPPIFYSMATHLE